MNTNLTTPLFSLSLRRGGLTCSREYPSLGPSRNLHLHVRVHMPHATHMPDTCCTHATHMLHTCHTHATHMPHTCHTHAAHMPHTCHTHARHMPDTCHTHATHMPHTCHTHARHMPHTCHTHATHMPHTCHTHATHILHTCYIQMLYLTFVLSSAGDNKFRMCLYKIFLSSHYKHFSTVFIIVNSMLLWAPVSHMSIT